MKVRTRLRNSDRYLQHAQKSSERYSMWYQPKIVVHVSRCMYSAGHAHNTQAVGVSLQWKYHLKPTADKVSELLSESTRGKDRYNTKCTL